MNRRSPYLRSWLLWLWAAGLLAACAGPVRPQVDGPASAAAAGPAGAPGGRVYYVAAGEPGASDGNDGRSPTYRGGTDGPWLTIGHAAAELQAGDTAYVRGGVYYEAGIAFAHPGASGAPITLSAYLSETVSIDGSGARGSSGIEFREGRGHYVLRGLRIHHMPRSGIATHGDTRRPYRDITIRDCIIHDNGLSGIRLAAVDGFEVANVECYGNAFYGLDITSSESGALSPANGWVRDSSFYDHTGQEGHGLAINQGHHITVTGSVAYHNTIHGFDVSDWPRRGELSHDITFESNRSFDNGVAGFAVNSDSHHVVYRGNVAWRNGAAWAGRGASSGFLCYGGCRHVAWYHNVSLANSDAGFWIEDTWGRNGDAQDSVLILENNVAYLNGPEGGDARPALVVEGRQWQLRATHNNWAGAPGFEGLVAALYVVGEQGQAYTAADVNGGALGAGTLSLDPLFLDPAGPDVRLRPGSPCIDAGTDTGAGRPFLGAAPDLGAYEIEPAP